MEDDNDHEFHYDGRPILPLASADAAGVVVYIGTLSKILAPGLRIGYLRAPKEVITRATAYRSIIDRQGDRAMEHAIAELLEEGEVQRHARRDALLEEIDRRLRGTLSFSVPAGGIALWARVHGVGVDVDAWAERAVRKGTAFQPAKRLAFDGRSRPFARFGYAFLDEKEIAEAVKRLAAARAERPGQTR